MSDLPRRQATPPPKYDKRNILSVGWRIFRNFVLLTAYGLLTLGCYFALYRHLE
ncbi:Uncharacterised protein [Bergeriella denitrificans]|uniref:Uncharacterized protein n=1 Tax=Bergeriella denitrificans TaxID=494 RepID=A0A378UFK6_BERDE|nr:hypothetical protein [Bergeriella denitrificans]STZ75489.1 Uncharacterised protein [Bergeriella denitrificans]